MLRPDHSKVPPLPLPLYAHKQDFFWSKLTVFVFVVPTILFSLLVTFLLSTTGWDLGGETEDDK